MAIEIRCTACERKLRVPEAAIGKRGKCPSCNAVFVVSTNEQLEESNEVSSSSRHRFWLIPVGIVVLMSTLFAPTVPIGLGIVMLVFCAATFFPKTKKMSLRVLKADAANTAMRWGRIAVCCIVGLGFISAGSAMTLHRANQNERAAQRAAKDAEVERLREEANIRREKANDRVKWLVERAEASWKNGAIDAAKRKLRQAENVKYASRFGAVESLRIRMANAEVDALLERAIEAMRDGDDDRGNSILAAAMDVEYADNKAKVTRFQRQIEDATDTARILTQLSHLADDEIINLERGGDLPRQFQSEYEWLEHRTSAIVNEHIGTIADARERKRQQRREEEQRIADARKKAEEARRKAEEEQLAREAAAKQAAEEAEAAERARLNKRVGETLSVGYMSYKVWKVYWSDNLCENPILNKKADAKWLFVEITIRNNDSEPRTIPPLYLIDENGNRFESSSLAYAVDNNIGPLDSLNPGVSKQGYLVYDLPPHHSYRLLASGGFWSKETGYITLTYGGR